MRSSPFSLDRIENRILLLRGQKVLLDADLAALYEVTTKRFNEQVRRNTKRFPADFMFQLSQDEWISLRSQFATLKEGRGQHRKYLPHVRVQYVGDVPQFVIQSAGGALPSIAESHRQRIQNMPIGSQKPSPSPENPAPLIYLLRGEKVLLGEHLADLYAVPVKVLNQAVKRNIDRFPEDFMFQLSRDEMHAVLRSRSQIVTLKRGQNIKYLPYAFTEQGIAMLSSVLRSPRALEVNIAIMRTFVRLRRLMDSNRHLARKIEAMEENYDEKFAVVFDAIKRLIAEDESRKVRPKRPIGFLP